MHHRVMKNMHFHQRFASRGILVFATAALLAFTGCSESTTHGTVQGTVTLDGEPLPEGVVRFVPTDRSTGTASAAITNGEYSATVPIGLNRLEFSAPKVTGKQKMYETPDSPTVDVVTELIPERYNLQSELQLQVDSGTSQHSNELLSE